MNSRKAERKMTVAGSIGGELDREIRLTDLRPSVSENSRKSAKIGVVLGITGLLAVGWMQHHGQMKQLEARIAQLEASAQVLTPLTQVMAGARNPTPVPNAYQAVQATGPIDVPHRGGDNPLAWCPAVKNGGAEWIELTYEHRVTAKELKIHASFNPGAVVRVLAGGESDALEEIWSGVGASEPVQTITISPPSGISRVRLELDTSRVPGWNEIDAVALVDPTGRAFWAQRATASSVWSKASEE